jgi:hypothetical protein
LELHAFPRIGFRPIGEIKTLELATCLEAIERGGIVETSNRVKQLIQQVFRYATRRGIIDHNPAGDLRDIIRYAEVTNRACIPPAELPALLQDMKAYKGDPMTKAAMRVVLLTFVRTGSWSPPVLAKQHSDPRTSSGNVQMGPIKTAPYPSRFLHGFLERKMESYRRQQDTASLRLSPPLNLPKMTACKRIWGTGA